jgi:hypothetical protein
LNFRKLAMRSNRGAGFDVRRNNEVATYPLSHGRHRIAGSMIELPKIRRWSMSLLTKKGWLFIIEPTKMKKNLKGLYYGEHAENFMGEEAERLWAMADEEFRIAADGGASVDDVFEAIGGKSWKEFVKAF